MENLEKKLSESIESLKERIDAKLDEAQQSHKQFGEEFKKEYKGEVSEMVKNMETMQKQLDDIQMSAQRSSNRPQAKGWVHELGEELKKSESFERFKNGENKGFSLELKAALTTAANASGEAAIADRAAGIRFDPTRPVRMRDLLPTFSTSATNTHRFVQEASYTSNAAMTAETSAYGEDAFVLEVVDTAIKKLGATLKLPIEMWEDIDGLQSYVGIRMPEKVLNVEDTQILSGNGSGANIVGLQDSTGGVTAFDETSAGEFYQYWASGDVTPTRYDVLVAAINQCIVGEYRPSAIILHPSDYHKLLVTKASDGQYVFDPQTGFAQVLGVPVLQTTAQTSGTFLVGDFNLGTAIARRKGLTVEFAYNNEDDFDKDLLTIKGSTRFALPIYRKNAFAFGTFSGAIAALQA